MGKRRMKNRARQASTTVAPHATPELGRRWRARIAWIVAGVPTILGLVLSVLAFLPRTTLDASGTFKPERPYPIVFTLVNSGPIPLRNVQPSLGLCVMDMRPAGPRDSCRWPAESQLFPEAWMTPSLGVDEKFTLRFDDLFRLSFLREAQISIVVSYQPWFLPIRRKSEYRLETVAERDGTVGWRFVPLEK